MEKPLLNNPEIAPESIVLEYALGDAYPIYNTLLMDTIDEKVGLTHEWRYYNDGKSWLCKVQFKKKTVFWLSIWEYYFKIGFYFTEKQLDGLFDLSIDSSIKDQLNQVKLSGKFIPLGLSIRSINQLEDVMRLIDFKKFTLK